MWAIRILTGNKAGQVFPLKEGSTRIGRGAGADIIIDAGGISKEHLEITVSGEQLLFTDLNSSNGTFLNGTRVKHGVLKLGDKVGIHSIIADIVVMNDKPKKAPSKRAQLPSQMFVSADHLPAAPTHAPIPHGNPYGHDQFPAVPEQHLPSMAMQAPPPVQRTFSESFNDAINEKVMPGFFQLTEQFEFKYILMGFVAAYVIMVTLMAMVPMKQITSDSISVESRRRAITVARSLARGNEKAVRSGDMNNFSVDYALREDGVDDVYVVSNEGRIVAPPDRSGNIPKEMSFFRGTAMKAGEHESSAEIGDGKVAAAVPILGFDAELQHNVAKAYGIVIYNQGEMQFDDGRVLSLFIQMLALALVAGGILFFVLYRLIEYPFMILNQELDGALRDKREHADIKVQLPILQSMLINLNSLLARAANPNSNQAAGHAGPGSKNHEYLNVLQLIGYPAILVDSRGTILRGNAAFPATTGIPLVNIENQKITSIPDQAMQKNFAELMRSSLSMTSQLATDTLEINGTKFTTSCQATTTSTGEVDCFFITISPLEGADGQAA